MQLARRLAAFYRRVMSEFDDDLDATGLICPLPVLKARKRLLALAPGRVLRVRTDDPAAVIDMPHFCAEGGHELLSQKPAPDGGQVWLVRRSGQSGTRPV